MLKKVVLFAGLTCLLLSTAYAFDSQLEQQLNTQYRDKILALRHPFESRTQEYAADGAPLTTGDEGPWTVYGRMLVTSVQVNGSEMRVKGKRALYIFDAGGQMTPLPEDSKHRAESLKITVRLQEPLASADQATAILGRVFAMTGEDIVGTAPPYWRDLLGKKLMPKPASNSPGKESKNQSEQSGSMVYGDGKVFHLGEHDVKGPRVVYHPAPEFTEAARSRKVQGLVGLNVVIDPEGSVRNVNIVRAMGMGLDESAVKTVRTWRFEPATQDGRPVPVAVYIEVTFHLY